VVYLKSGKKVEGTAGEGKKPGTLEVRVGEGTVMVVPVGDVERVEKKQSPVDELDARLRSAPAGRIEPFEELLAFARDKRLPGRTRLLARKILELDPDHEVARKELGYVVFDNRWVLQTELKGKKDLVNHQGEWMTVAERDRRALEEGRKEVEDLLNLSDSENTYLQEFSIRKALSRKDPAARDAFLRHISDERRVPRMVAIRGLAGFPAPDPLDAESRRALEELHKLALKEESEEVLKVLHLTLARFAPRDSFLFGLQTSLAGSERDRRRAGEILYYTLRKSFVPDLCRAVVGADGTRNPVAHGVLVRALRTDQGYDPQAWLRFWRDSADQFADE
jgi:hypothetical protein